MARSKGVTLRGPAAGAFVNAMMGKQAESDDDKALRVATFVHLNMKDQPQAAVALIKALAKDGLDAASKLCTRDP